VLGLVVVDLGDIDADVAPIRIHERQRLPGAPHAIGFGKEAHARYPVGYLGPSRSSKSVMRWSSSARTTTWTGCSTSSSRRQRSFVAGVRCTPPLSRCSSPTSTSSQLGRSSDSFSDGGRYDGRRVRKQSYPQASSQRVHNSSEHPITPNRADISVLRFAHCGHFRCGSRSPR
jgi:hypothetical protein